MASRSRKDRYGKGGLYIIRREAWNEFKQAYEMVDFYQASKEVQDPQNPDKRKRVTGTGRSPQEAQARLNKSLERFYKKRGLAEAGMLLKSGRNRSQSLTEHFEEWYSELRPERVS